MKQFSYIVILFFSIQVVGQDSSKVRAKFNYVEFNLTSINNTTPFNLNNLFNPKQAPLGRSSYTRLYSFNSINLGIKYNRHKLTIGVVNNPVYVLNYLEGIEYKKGRINTQGNNFNINANYYFYLSKKQKKFNHFLNVNFNKQTVRDVIDNTLNYEQKKGSALGLGYGISFYIKKHFLIEPNILLSVMQFKNKDIYTYTTYLTTTYKTEITRAGLTYFGLGLKLSYIIPFKNK